MNAAGRLLVDVGSSRIKVGWYAPVGDCVEAVADRVLSAPSRLPPPDEHFALWHHQRPREQWGAELCSWLDNRPQDVATWLATVDPGAAAVVDELLVDSGRPPSRRIAASDVPLEIHVEEPLRVGIDRLLNAVAVNQIRYPRKPAIVVDLGTAVTVDLVDAEGAFAGGAILPGLGLAASALHRGTRALPQLRVAGPAPPCVGKSTEQAILSGIYWGTLGGVAELLRRFDRQLAGSGELYLTGGDAPLLVDPLAELVGRPPRVIPHLVLAGAAATAVAIEQRAG